MTDETSPDERLTDLAMIHGGDLLHWPDGVLAEARGLVDADPALQSVLDAALARSRAVDALLSDHALQGAGVSDALVSRVLADAQTSAPARPHPARRAVRRPRRGAGPRWGLGALAPTAALAASALLGVFLGINAPGDLTAMAVDAAGLTSGLGEDDILAEFDSFLDEG